MSPLVAALLLAGGLAAGAAISFNRFVSQRNLIANSWSNVDTELRRRYDLIPNLVETVGAYATHEKTAMTEVIAARAGAVAADGTTEQAGAETALVHGIRRLLAVSEAYPELLASEHFLELQRELVTTEDRIQAARRLYNGNVRDYNRRIESVPSRLIAALAGFDRADYFEVEPSVRDARRPNSTRTR